MSLTHPRMSTIITIAVVFLLVGTFTSVTVQGGFQVLFAIPLAFYFWRAVGRDFQLPANLPVDAPLIKMSAVTPSPSSSCYAPLVVGRESVCPSGPFSPNQPCT